MENKHFEIKTIEHKGVKVSVEINYELGTASLVEVDLYGENLSAPPKKWVFAGRTLDHMNGWLLVLQAMTKAVEQCKADLENDLAQKSAFKEKTIERVLKGVAELEVREQKIINKKKKK